MVSLLKSNMDNTTAFTRLREELRACHGDLCFGRVEVDGPETVLQAEHGGIRVFWICSGAGEVFLPAGFRTKEGDGPALPSVYTAERPAPRFMKLLDFIEQHLGALDEAAQVPVRAILARRQGGAYRGEFANELWKLEHAHKPWSADPNVVSALETLFAEHRAAGFSEKTESSWEPIVAGDQVIAAGAEELRVRGKFVCFSIEKLDHSMCPFSRVRRLRYLKDSSGGCNFDFDPFRRLPLTWHWNLPDESGDGVNFVNSHVVNIAQETSPTHFHPPVARGGGAAQNEIYLVLDPRDYGLNTYGRRAQLLTFPDLHDLRKFETHNLSPGDLVYIPAGTGHRGIDVFVNVITLPGFKPRNEFYIDREILETTDGAVPCNKALLHLRNYDALESVLGY